MEMMAKVGVHLQLGMRPQLGVLWYFEFTYSLLTIY